MNADSLPRLINLTCAFEGGGHSAANVFWRAYTTLRRSPRINSTTETRANESRTGLSLTLNSLEHRTHNP